MDFYLFVVLRGESLEKINPNVAFVLYEGYWNGLLDSKLSTSLLLFFIINFFMVVLSSIFLDNNHCVKLEIQTETTVHYFTPK